MMHSVKNMNRQQKNTSCCCGCQMSSRLKPKSKTIRSREKRNWKKDF